MGMKKKTGSKLKKWIAGIGVAILVLGLANALGYFGNAIVDPRHSELWAGIGIVVIGLTMLGEYLKG